MDLWLCSPLFAQAEGFVLPQVFSDRAIRVVGISKNPGIDRANTHTGWCSGFIHARSEPLSQSAVYALYTEGAFFHNPARAALDLG
jgi:hypothetical protein